MGGKRWFKAIVSPNGRTVAALFEIADFDTRIFRLDSGVLPVDPVEVEEDFLGQQEIYLAEGFQSVLTTQMDKRELLSIDDLAPYILSAADELQECTDNWNFSRILHLAQRDDRPEEEFDSLKVAETCLNRILLAREMRILASGSRYLSLERKYRLYVEALKLERELPDHGLLSLGILADDMHPADAEWLLREHLGGRWNGLVGNGELGFDIRSLPWFRDSEMGVWVGDSGLPARTDLDAWERFIQERIGEQAPR